MPLIYPYFKCMNVQCRMISCYLCRQQLSRVNPYDHFNRGHEGANGKCELWDLDGRGDPRQRHAAEVRLTVHLIHCIK